MARIRKIPQVAAVEPLLVLPGALNLGTKFVVVPIAGVNPAARQRPYELTSGRDLAPGPVHEVLLGERLAKRLDASVGDEVELQVLLATHPRLVLDDEGVGKFTVTVAGLVGFAATDSAFVSRDFLGAELGLEHAASALSSTRRTRR